VLKSPISCPCSHIQEPNEPAQALSKIASSLIVRGEFHVCPRVIHILEIFLPQNFFGILLNHLFFFIGVFLRGFSYSLKLVSVMANDF
jgi:hypothetical protein